MHFRFYLLCFFTLFASYTIYAQTTLNCADFIVTQELIQDDFVIGANVTEIKFRMRGGEGGNARLDGPTCDRRVRGGVGALVEMTFPVSDAPGEINSLRTGGIIRLYVGNHGQNADRGCSPSPVGVYGGGGGATAVLYRDGSTLADQWEVLAIAGGGGGGARPVAGDFRTGQGGQAGISGGNSGTATGGTNGNCGGFTPNSGPGGAFFCDYPNDDQAGGRMITAGFGNIAQREVQVTLKPDSFYGATAGTRNGRANGGQGITGGGAGANSGGGGGGFSGGAAARTWNGGGGASFVTSTRGIYGVNAVNGVDGGSQNIPVRGFVSIDVPAASAVCPANVTLQLGATGQAEIDPVSLFEEPSQLSCGASTTLLFTPNAFPLPIDLATVDYTFECPSTFGRVGDLRYLILARDGSIASECTTPLILRDNIPPFARCRNAVITLNEQGVATLDPSLLDNGSTDNCAITGLQASRTNFSCSDVGQRNVSLTVLDSGGNLASCGTRVTIRDNFAAKCKDIDYVVTTNAESLTPADIDDGTFSPCNTITDRQLSATDFQCPGTEIVTLTVTNSAGATSSCMANVTVMDGIAPVARCKNSFDAVLGPNGQVTITPQELDNGSTDDCSPNLEFLAFPATFTCSDLGGDPTTTFQVRDEAGNLSAPCTVSITVSDATGPIARCKSTIDAVLDAEGRATITPQSLDNGSTDNCSSSLEFLAFPATFTCSDLDGDPTTTLLVRDEAGNLSAPCITTVNVLDLISPAISCLPVVSTSLSSEGELTLLPSDVLTGVSDNCTAANFTLSQQIFDCSDVGERPITITVTDGGGNTSSCETTVIINDVLRARCKDISYVAEVGAPILTSNDIDDGSFSLCGIIIDRQIEPINLECSGPQTATLTVTNVFGNTASCTATIMVTDALLPTARCKRFITPFLDENGRVRLDPIDFDDGSTDNCSDNLTYIVSRQNFNCGNLNVTQLIPFWVRDEAGNLSEPCISSVDVIDNLPPVANCVSSLTAALDDNGELTLTPEQFDAGSSDNCGQGNLWMSISPASFDCDYLGSNIVTLNVEDDSGNRSSCETTLQLETETSPQLVCQDITVTLDENNAVTVSPAELIVDEIVGCYPLTERSVSPADFGPEDIGPNEVVVTVRNGLEETATCNVTVKVAANVLPVTWLDFTATLTDDKAAILNWSTATETDNDYFVVEHGTDGTGFATIAFQQGNGSTGLENHYAYTHLDPATGWNYYRLRQVDLDGTASYSTTVAVQLVNSSSSELTVFPNPVHDRVQLRFEELKQMGTVRIYASSGRLLSTQNLAVGRSSLHVETSTWPAGVYAVEMVVGAQRTVKRMIKLD